MTVREPIKRPKIAATRPAGGRGRRARCDIGDAIQGVEKYDLTLIFSEFVSILPININRQNVCKVGIYNNPRNKTEREVTAACLTALLAGRFDCYALQDTKPDKSGRHGYCKHTIQWSKNLKVMMNHICGGTTLALYQIALDDTVKWICYDIDDHKGEKGAEVVREDVLMLMDELNKHGIPFLLEASGSPNSYHIWVLLKPTKTCNAYRFSRQIAAEAGIKCEIFPKQKGLNGDSKYGNLVKVPLGVNRKTGVKSQFLDSITFEPYAGMVPIPGIVHLRDMSEAHDIVERGVKARSIKRCKEELSRKPMRLGQDLRPCMQGVLANKTPLEGPEGHEMRVAIATEAWNIGLPIEKAIKLFRDQPDYNPEMTRKNVKDIYLRCYYLYECDTLKEKCGSIVMSYCHDCPMLHES